MRILFVEPDHALRSTIRSFFEKAGHKADIARSGQEGIDFADSNTPDAVVLEIALARHSGVEFLYELRSHADWHHIPVIIYSKIKSSEIQYSKSARENLNIRAHFFKPETSLKTLLQKLEKKPNGVKI